MRRIKRLNVLFFDGSIFYSWHSRHLEITSLIAIDPLSPGEPDATAVNTHSRRRLTLLERLRESYLGQRSRQLPMLPHRRPPDEAKGRLLAAGSSAVNVEISRIVF